MAVGAGAAEVVAAGPAVTIGVGATVAGTDEPGAAGEQPDTARIDTTRTTMME
jgi:hypothetical protein